MLKLFLLGLSLCACSTVVWAQPENFSGYELLIKAAQSIQPADEAPAPGTKLAPDEILKRQKVTVQRNAPALAIARRALEEKIELPDIGPGQPDMRPYPSFRELARQFAQESDVRRANGDFMGALSSRFDALEIGVTIENGGGSLAFMVAKSIQSSALDDIESLITPLNAQQAREAAQRLDEIESHRPTYAQITTIEKEDAFTRMNTFFQDNNWKTQLLDNVNSEEAKTALQNATPASIKQEVGALWDQIIANAGQPYGATQTPLPKASNAASDLFAGVTPARASERFLYESARTQTILLSLALQLKAIKTEKKAYPTTLATPIDPFSDGKPLIYKVVGDSYRLYSVGPDKTDDGGQPIAAPIRVRSTGDITAPVY